MEIHHFVIDNPESTHKFNPVEVLKQNLTLVNNVLKYLKQTKPEMIEKWTGAFAKRLQDDTDGLKVDYASLELQEFFDGLEYLKGNSALQEVIIQFSFGQLKLPEDYVVNEEEIETNFYDWSRASNVLRYHRVKAFFDIMEREEGINLWKKIVYQATEDALANNEECHPTVKEITDGWIAHGKSEVPSIDYTVAIFDDHMVALRFDRCPVYDAVKHLEDREAVHLSYCWTGEPEESLNKKSRRKFTPCDLYTADHCIEFYWNNDVHPDAKPPSDEFWKREKERLHNE